MSINELLDEVNGLRPVLGTRPNPGKLGNELSLRPLGFVLILGKAGQRRVWSPNDLNAEVTWPMPTVIHLVPKLGLTERGL
ncbi:hypothetical protein ES288_D06G222100v1 [Gossypium darwinii]|uniref:Uncharacterized protein n=1 Tax=Gossypium darwinii TaxID=34276 RepID=A0A5D2C8F1_GOSDA|nr:hypothetical protein ES288_D06G222100v1 [Gossypium darwinii]